MEKQGSEFDKRVQEASTVFNSGNMEQAYKLFEGIINDNPSSDAFPLWAATVTAGVHAGVEPQLYQFLKKDELGTHENRSLAEIFLLFLCGRNDACLDALKTFKPETQAAKSLAMLFHLLVYEYQGFPDLETEVEKILVLSDHSAFSLLYLQFAAKSQQGLLYKINKLALEKLDSYAYDPFHDVLKNCIELLGVQIKSNEYDNSRKRFEVNRICRMNWNNPFVLARGVKVLIEFKDLDAAQRLLDRILSISPNFRCRNDLAYIEAFQGNFDKAVQLSQAELQIHRENLYAYLNLSNFLTYQENISKALEYNELAIDKFGKDSSLILQWTKLLAETGTDKYAGELLNGLFDSHVIGRELLAESINVALKINDLDLAGKLLDLQPQEDIETQKIAITYYVKTGQIEKAMQVAMAVYETDDSIAQTISKDTVQEFYSYGENHGWETLPPTLVAILGISMAYKNQGADQATLKLVMHGLKNGDHTKKTITHAINMSLLLNDQNSILDIIDETLGWDELPDTAIRLVFRTYAEKKQDQEIVKLLQILEPKAHKNKSLLLIIAETYGKLLGDHERAIKLLQTDTLEEGPVENSIALAEQLVEEEYIARAIDLCEKIKERFPDNKNNLVCLGFAYQKSGRLLKALEVANAIIKVEPTDKWAVEYLANHLFGIRDFDGVKSLFEKALEADPSLVNFRKIYANLLVQNLYDLFEASRQLELALDVDFANEPLRTKFNSYKDQAGHMLEAFGEEAIDWAILNKNTLVNVSKKLSEGLTDQVLGICWMPPEQDSSDDSKNDARDVTSKQKDKPEDEVTQRKGKSPELLIILSDIAPSDSTDEEIKKRDAIIKRILEQEKFEQKYQSLHWNGIWQYCLDGKYELINRLSNSFVLHDSRYVRGLRHLWHHRERVLKKFDRYIAGYVVAGSFVRGDSKPDSDIDVWIVIDDTDVKEMSRSELDYKLRVIIQNFAQESADQLEINNIVHIQTYLLTNYWISLRDSHPVITTFLKDGRPLYDRGIFTAWRILLNDGKISQTRDVISKKLKTARDDNEKTRGGIFNLAEQAIYLPVLTVAQELLLVYGIQPPNPIRTAEELSKLGVLSPESIQVVNDSVDLITSAKHGGLQKIKAEDIDKINSKVVDFLDEVDQVINKIYERGVGVDVTAKSLSDSYKYLIQEMLEILHQDTCGFEDGLRFLLETGNIEPIVVSIVYKLDELKVQEQKLPQDYRTELFLSKATQYLEGLKNRADYLRTNALRKNRIRFTCKDSIGELAFFRDKLFVIHDLANIENSRISKISLGEDDYGRVGVGRMEELMRMNSDEDQRTRGVLSNSLLKIVADLLNSDISLLID
jgi:tetratricopeptide (TPR) repeat protein/predicted nucleotidyltransferase